MFFRSKRTGFTIVELLIVIVVIGILAAITIVAFNGVQNRAKVAVVQSAAAQASKKILAYAALNSDQYPTALTDADVKDGTNGISYQYTSDNTVSPRKFAVTATTGSLAYYASEKGGGAKEGTAPGHNLVVWNKTTALSTTPFPTATVDTSVFRTSTASLRVNPNSVGHFISASPITAAAGQTLTFSFWLKTDANWNGQGNNSKVRFGNATNDALLTVCIYNGVKTSWTFVTCSHTVSASAPKLTMSIGNDGSVGNIWLDDITLTLSE